MISFFKNYCSYFSEKGTGSGNYLTAGLGVFLMVFSMAEFLRIRPGVAKM